MKNLKSNVLVLLLTLSLTMCGTKTGTGIVSTGSDGAITVKSSAFSTAARSLFSARGALDSDTVALSTFKLCIGELRLENDGGSTVSNTGEDHIEFKPGLIDISDGAAKTWGTPNIPVNFLLKRIKLKVKKDSSTCGVSYSVKVNDISTEEEVELRWTLTSPVTINANSSITLSLQNLATELKTEAAKSGFNEEQLKKAIERVEETAHKDED